MTWTGKLLVGKWVDYKDVAQFFSLVHGVTVTHGDFNKLADMRLLEQRAGETHWQCRIFNHEAFELVIEALKLKDAEERLHSREP
jgi:hypothetical protein